MAEQKAQERTMERSPAEVRTAEPPNGELPSRRSGFERMAAEAMRAAQPTQPPHGQPEEAGLAMTRMMQETTRGMRAAMMLPVAPSAGFVEMQEAFAELATGMMRNNLRLMQEVMRIYSPQDHATLMQKMMRQWLDAVTASQTALLQAARQGNEQVLRPLEDLAERQRHATQ